MIAVYKQKDSGKCWIGGKKIRCNKHPIYFVCSRDGKPRSSRLEGQVCKIHLEKIISKLCKEGHDFAELP